MDFKKLKLSGLVVITPKVFGDQRGFFKETYNREEFEQHGIKDYFVQDNDSFSHQGVVRGLHYQLPPYTQAKLVKVVSGEIIDVVLDIRRKSSTFGQINSIKLSSDNHLMLYIPPGFAHGFACLSKEVYFQYKVSNFYEPEYERGINWKDSNLNIEWGISNPQATAKDNQWPYLTDIPENELL